MFSELIRTINNSLAIDLPERLSFAELHLQLSKHINQLIQTDFEKLVTLLYRIDVSESKLTQLLKDHPGEDAGDIIATLIIERQEQKIKSKKQNPPGTDIPETEKW
jgi:hypothetical protein